MQHIEVEIGTDASTLIHEVLVAMKGGDGTINSIKKTIHIHPALSEVIAKAAERISWLIIYRGP